MQSHLNIETHSFYRENKQENKKHRPLALGCSGGAGHNASIEAIIKSLINENVISKSDLPTYAPVLFTQQITTGAAKIQVGAVLSSIVPNRLNDFPQLPNLEDLKKEVSKISGDQKQRNYIDMLLDVFPEGYYHVAIWNILQRNDKTEELRKLIPYQELNDKNNHQAVYQYFLDKLNEAYKNNKPYTEIISTQAMALPALCDAVEAYNNAHSDSPIKIHQYMTDLPTVGAVHFFDPLKRLNASQRQQMYVYGVNLSENFSNLDEKFNLSQLPFAKWINIDPKFNPMVRPGFKAEDLKSISFNNKTTLKIQFKDGKPDEEIKIEANEKIASIMLSSQAGYKLINYARALSQNNLYSKIFVFGGNSDHLKDERIKLIKENERLNLNKPCKIFWLDSQDDFHSARILVRSNLKVKRNGGSSGMEEMAMPHNNPDEIILFHGKRDTKAEFTSGISWEDENRRAVEKYLSKPKKIACTSASEILDELELRWPLRTCSNQIVYWSGKRIETDPALLELVTEINSIRGQQDAKAFVNALDALHSELHSDYLDRKAGTLSIEKIQSSAAIQIAKETTEMLKEFKTMPSSDSDTRNQMVINIMDKYEKKCHRIAGYSFFAKAVAVVIAIGIGFVLGAVIGGGIGFILGAWSAPGAVVTTILGFLNGAYSGAALGLVAGTFATGITIASFSSYLLFKPNKMTNDVTNVARTGKDCYSILASKPT